MGRAAQILVSWPVKSLAYYHVAWSSTPFLTHESSLIHVVVVMDRYRVWLTTLPAWLIDADLFYLGRFILDLANYPTVARRLLLRNLLTVSATIPNRRWEFHRLATIFRPRGRDRCPRMKGRRSTIRLHYCTIRPYCYIESIRGLGKRYRHIL